MVPEFKKEQGVKMVAGFWTIKSPFIIPWSGLFGENGETMVWVILRYIFRVVFNWDF